MIKLRKRRRKLIPQVLCIMLFCLLPSIGNTAQNQPEFIRQIQQELFRLHNHLISSDEAFWMVDETFDTKIALALAKIGNWDLALQVINTNPYKETQPYAPLVAYEMSHLVLVAASVGDIEKVSELTELTLQKERFGDNTIVAFVNLAKAAAKLEETELSMIYMEQAMQLLEDPHSIHYTLWMLPTFWGELSAFLVQQGKKDFLVAQLERLIQIANSTTAVDKRDMVLLDIAMVLAKIGDVGKAQEIIETFNYLYQQSWAFFRLASTCVDNREFAQAIEIFNIALQLAEQYIHTRKDYKKTRIHYERAFYFSLLANAFVEVGERAKAQQFLQRALEEIEMIKTKEEFPLDILLNISQSFAKIEQRETANHLIDLAIQHVEPINRQQWKMYNLSKIAEVCVEIGNPKKGLQLIKQTEDFAKNMTSNHSSGYDHGKAQILANNAIIYAKLNKFDKISELLKQLGNANDYEWVEDTWYYKADVLMKSIQFSLDVIHLQKIYDITNNTVSDSYEKAVVFAAILSAWGEQQSPQLKGIQAVRILNERDLL